MSGYQICHDQSIAHHFDTLARLKKWVKFVRVSVNFLQCEQFHKIILGF